MAKKLIRLTDLFPEEIAVALDLKPYQGQQVFRWLHQKRIFDIASMTDLSKALRERLAASAIPRQADVAAVRESTETGTKKVLLRLLDAETVETVLIRSGERTTLCVSSQVGCAVKCAFCATGQSGFVRNLSAGEIVEQALHLLREEHLGDRTPNIVVMGMGEPFQNYDAVLKAVRLFMREEGLGIGARKITISTVGHVPGIRRLAEEDLQIRLAVSLHAATDEKRARLVPMNRKHGLDELMTAVREYVDRTGRQVSFEWTLLGGVNDSPEDAKELAALIRALRASVNVIPWNPVEGAGFRPPSEAACRAFMAELDRASITATLRQEKGGDIQAACGQLRLGHGKGKPRSAGRR